MVSIPAYSFVVSNQLFFFFCPPMTTSNLVHYLLSTPIQLLSIVIFSHVAFHQLHVGMRNGRGGTTRCPNAKVYNKYTLG